MRVKSLTIRNFRAIQTFQIDALSDFVVIAGPNGCGKSTVLDALRLIKSIYVRDEWNRWFSEFGIDLQRPISLATLFHDQSSSLEIAASFVLSESEAKYLHSHAHNIALALALADITKRHTAITGDPPIEPPNLSSNELDQARNSACDFADKVKDALGNGSQFDAAVRMTTKPEIDVTDSPVASVMFSCFNPEALGEIEFHGSRRWYAREVVNNIRLRIGDRSEERCNRFLYDLENKYKNIKTQLGEEYVASILRKADPAEAPLQRSIKELFRTFFPGKTFKGVTVAEDNSMQFPVQLSSGKCHDIDELSSGEKEIVYGYLGLRTGTPRRSIVLVDEPELHLNPALVQGLPGFYKTHLAEALDAQVWIVTHSDAILRQAVRSPSMRVYHMARPGTAGQQQAVRIDSQDAVEAAVLDLIGELGAYRPHAKIVLVEGHKETRFDVEMIRRLFPDLTEKGNFVPVGNRRMTVGVRVRLLEILQESGLTGRAVSITDGDLGRATSGEELGPGHFTWPVYEIENFLLEPDVLRAGARALLGRDSFTSDEDVVARLRILASDLVDELALDEVQARLNSEFVGSIKIGGSKHSPAEDLRRSTAASVARVAKIDIAAPRIEGLLGEARGRFTAYLSTNEFLDRFPGDRLLRAVARFLGVTGDHYRNVCLDQAQRLGKRPIGMADTLQAALM